MRVGASRVLWILTPVTATVSLVFLSVALSTNQWLHSEEKIANPLFNNTSDRDKEFLSKFTVSGLWKLCFTEPGKLAMKCIQIDYFPTEEYSPDPNDSTMAIPYAVTRAATFYFLSTLMLFCGEIFCLLGHFVRKKPIFTFTSGCIFIIAGLVMLGGMVIYISTFKAEVGRKLQSQSSLQPTPLFIYTYGFSFLLVVSGFMTSELAGTFAIFLYINLQQTEVAKKDDRDATRRFRNIPPSPEDHTPCRRHLPLRRGSSRCEMNSRDNSPHASTSRGQLSNPSIPLSESMKDLSYFNFPPFSRDATCNTLSTTTDLAREFSREFSYETLRRTTPV